MSLPAQKPPLFYFCLTFVLFCSKALYAQDKPIKFDKFSTEHGLSSNTIFSIFQDSRGFLWIGTIDGLNRYDGNKFQTFRHNPNDTSSISNNHINGISEDSKGMLWIGTHEGLCRFDPQKGKFYRVRLPVISRKSVSVISWAGDEELVVYSLGKLYLYNVKNDGIRELTNPSTAFNVVSGLTTIQIDREGNPFFVVGNSRSNKFFTLNRHERKIEHIKTISASGPVKQQVRTFFVDSRNNHWIAEGISGKLFHYPASLGPGDFNLLKETWQNISVINKIYEDRDGRIWVCTAKGLYRYDYSDKSFTEIFSGEESLGNQAGITTTIFQDKTGVIWVGSFNGLYKLNPNYSKFSHFSAGANSLPQLSSNFILGLYPSSDKKIWINYSWGIRHFSLLDIQRNQIKHLEFNHPLFRDYVVDITKNKLYFKKDVMDLWVRRNSSRFEGEAGPLPYFIVFDSRNSIYNIENKWITLLDGPNIPTGDEIMDVQVFKDEIWQATNREGLFLFNTTDRTQSHYRFDSSGNSISTNALISLLIEENGNIWIGTNGAGLNYFDRQKNRFIHYTKENGLPHNSIYSMVMDNKRRLWLGTGNGLSCFDINAKKFSNFNRSDGLLNTEFNRYSAVKLPDGKILMGGMDGIEYFDPDVVLKETIKPSVQITDFKVYNKSVAPASHLSLSHKENYITIEFSAMDFRNPAANTYAYKLDGIDKDWITAGNQSSVSYATLSPGRYHFLVKAASSDGTWSETPAEIYFNIRTPWWRSGLFWGLSFLILVLGFYTIYRFRIQQIKKVYAVRSKISQDLHDEVGATLTSISYLSEVAKLQSNTRQTNSEDAIDKIGEFSREMIGEMNDIVWAINPANDKFEKIESRMRNFASILLATRNIHLEFSSDDKINHCFLGMQQRKNLFLIFKEAVNNAAKYSRCSAVSIKICREDHHILMEITDNGKGFDGNENGNGNGLKNMKARAVEIGANLLIDSFPGKGTRIRLSVPLTQNTY